MDDSVTKFKQKYFVKRIEFIHIYRLDWTFFLEMSYPVGGFQHPYQKMMEDISKIQTDFYSSHRKNIFMKTSQKSECAETISRQIPLEELIRNTIYIIPNSCSVYMDYPLFKTYVSPINYQIVVNHIFETINEVIRRCSTFEMHINLSTFTISAAERYSQIIQSFCNECCKNNTQYSELMNRMYIYNTPSMIQTISTIMVKYTADSIKLKTSFYTKEESQMKLNELFAV
jgi:hemoglobin-like flavoprotein